jgi:hypothetical protein
MVAYLSQFNLNDESSGILRHQGSSIVHPNLISRERRANPGSTLSSPLKPAAGIVSPSSRRVIHVGESCAAYFEAMRTPSDCSMHDLPNVASSHRLRAVASLLAARTDQSARMLNVVGRLTSRSA